MNESNLSTQNKLNLLSSTGEIQHVSETALWVASFRANESQRPDALFKDSLAVKLVGERGPQIVKHMEYARFTEWTLAIRTRIIDEMILSAVREEGVDTVWNLGAGVDTRPYRLELPSHLHWIEVDFPHMIDFKNQRLLNDKPVCHLERIPLDLTQREVTQKFFRSRGNEGKKLLVITEGVLPYLKISEVEALAEDLRTEAKASLWIVDCYTNKALQRFQRRGIAKKLQKAPIQFFPENWDSFFENLGWRGRSKKYLPIEGLRWGRPFPLPWWLKILVYFAPRSRREEFMHSAAYVVLEPKGRL